jgi:hypothetical protein
MVVKTIFDNKQSGFVNPFLQSAEMAKQAGNLDYDEFQKEEGKKIAAGAKEFAKLGRPTYSWVNNPRLLQVAPNSYDYKTMPYQGTYGLGLANAGINEGNINYYLDLMREKNRADDKSGGWKEIYGHMEKWSDQYAPQLKQYLETGKLTKGVSADTILQATDYGIRAAAQKQQNKVRGFLGPMLEGNIGAIAGTAFGFTPWGLAAGGPAVWGTIGGGTHGTVKAGGNPFSKQAIGDAITGYSLGSTAGTVGGKVAPSYMAKHSPSSTVTKIGPKGKVQGVKGPYGSPNPVIAGTKTAIAGTTIPFTGGKTIGQVGTAISGATVPLTAGKTVGQLASTAGKTALTAAQLSALGKTVEDVQLATTPQSILEAGQITPQFTQASPIANPIDIGNIFASQPTVASGNLGLPTNPLSGDGYYNQLSNALALNTPLPSLNVSPEVLSRANQRFSPFRTPVTLQNSYRRLNPLAVV